MNPERVHTTPTTCPSPKRIRKSLIQTKRTNQFVPKRQLPQLSFQKVDVLQPADVPINYPSSSTKTSLPTASTGVRLSPNTTLGLTPVRPIMPSSNVSSNPWNRSSSSWSSKEPPVLAKPPKSPKLYKTWTYRGTTRDLKIRSGGTDTITKLSYCMMNSPPDQNGKLVISTDSPTDYPLELKSKGVEFVSVLNPSSLSPTTIGLSGSPTNHLKFEPQSGGELLLWTSTVSYDHFSNVPQLAISISVDFEIVPKSKPTATNKLDPAEKKVSWPYASKPASPTLSKLLHDLDIIYPD